MSFIIDLKNSLRIRNSYLIFEAIKKIKNWPLYFLDFLFLVPKKHIVYYLRNGYKYLVRARTGDRGIMTTICLVDEYKMNQLFLSKDSIVIDIGANIGIFSVAVSSCAGKVFAFEPVKDNFDLLIENIKLNKLIGKIIPFNYAVSDKNEKLKIYLFSYNRGSHSIYAKGKRFEEVKAITLREVFDDNKIDKCDLLKIDAEGCEYKILFGLPDNYFYKIKRIYLECHNLNNLSSDEERMKFNSKYLKNFLISKGFKVINERNCFFAELI